jgi:hypothetical protein
MADRRTEIARISKTLSLELKSNEFSVENFLSRDLYRQRHADAVVETFGCSSMSKAYAILSAAAVDEGVDLQSLDELYHAYRSHERAFRLATDEFRVWLAQRSPEALHAQSPDNSVLGTPTSDRR